MLPVVGLSPIKASPHSSPFSSAAAKENISSFNRLASVANSAKKKKNWANNENGGGNAISFKASPNNNTNANTRRPFGTSTRDNIPRPVSVLTKKPSGNSGGKKALKVLGESQNVDKERTKVKGSTNAKDRMKEWEREKERLREMAQLEEMQKERDEIYENKKREEVKEKAKKVRIFDSEAKGKGNSEEKGEEEEKKTGNGLEKQIERQSAKKDVFSPVMNHATERDSEKENMDFSTSSVLPMFRSNLPLIPGLSISCCLLLP